MTARYDALNSNRNTDQWFKECGGIDERFDALPPSSFAVNDKLRIDMF